jgi:hypothetical protein
VNSRRRFLQTGTIGLVAAASGAPAAQREDAAVIEQTEYWAHSGRAAEVYQWRVHACDVRERIGLPRGRVWRRDGKSDTLPDVIWQLEYPDEPAKEADLKRRDESQEFRDVRDHMRTLYRRFERGFWRPR